MKKYRDRRRYSEVGNSISGYSNFGYWKLICDHKKWYKNKKIRARLFKTNDIVS